MLIRIVVQLTLNCLGLVPACPGLVPGKTWHFRRDWSFAPFVVVVGSKYFLPAPECLLFDRTVPDLFRDGSRQSLRSLSLLPAPLVREGFDAWRG